MNERFAITQVEGSDQDYYRLLQAGLRDFHVGQHISGPHDTFPFSLRVQDSASQHVGGVYALTYWDWLRIDLLWLREDFRGRGIARQLIQQAETVAQERGCQQAYTQAWETALGFYLKCGYRAVGELRDYPHGHIYYTLRKDF